MRDDDETRRMSECRSNHVGGKQATTTAISLHPTRDENGVKFVPENEMSERVLSHSTSTVGERKSFANDSRVD
jgi:hypothetical protein